MSDDDFWLKELAQVHREREAEERSRFDERWDRLSAGTLSPEEEAELKALAETSEEARVAYEAFRPLGEDFQARVVQEILKRDPVPVPKPVDPPPPKPLPFRPSPSQTFHRAGWAAAAALAATILVFLVRDPFSLLHGPASYPPLLVYTLAPVEGDKETRGGPEAAMGTPVFSSGSVLTLNAFPERFITDPVEAKAFATRGAELVPLDLQPKTEHGAVLLQGTLGEEIHLSPGDWRIWIVVFHPGRIPAMRELKAELDAGRTRHDDWEALSVEIRVEESQPSP